MIIIKYTNLGYINESGRLRLDRFEIFMERLSRIDIKNFAEYYCDLKYLEAKMNKYKNTENEEQISLKEEDSSKNCSPSIKVANLLKLPINMEMVFILTYNTYIYAT